MVAYGSSDDVHGSIDKFVDLAREKGVVSGNVEVVVVGLEKWGCFEEGLELSLGARSFLSW